MRAVRVAVGVYVLVVVLAGLGVVVTGLSAGHADAPGDRGVVDAVRVEMLAADQAMLQRMRISYSPAMATMIASDPMWVDPDMIRLQEANQAQLDRMIGRPYP
jgi:hypothetical protein